MALPQYNSDEKMPPPHFLRFAAPSGVDLTTQTGVPQAATAGVMIEFSAAAQTATLVTYGGQTLSVVALGVERVTIRGAFVTATSAQPVTAFWS